MSTVGDMDADVEKRGTEQHQLAAQADTDTDAVSGAHTSSSGTIQAPNVISNGKEKEERMGRTSLDAGKKLVGWHPEGDVDNPLTWPKWKKIRVLAVISSGSICVTCASSVVSSAYYGLEDELGASHEVAILGLSLFVTGLGIGPCLLAPFSEFYGRRPIYLLAFGGFFLLGFPVAFANNLPVFFIFRFLTGFAGSAFLSVAGGSVSDMWLPNDSLLPMSFYTVTPFLGPVLGPVYGGFIQSFSSTWRWCFWVITIWSFIVWIAILLSAPETYAPVLLAKKARHLRTSTGDEGYYAQYEVDVAQKSLVKTIAVTGSRVFSLLVLEPMLLLLCLWCAVLLGILYLFFELYPIVFAKHNFLPYQTGLSFIGIGLGCLIALATAPYWAARGKRQAEENGGVAPPESRLDMAKVGSILSPVGLFIFAFTTYANVHWIAPIIGSIFFGWAVIYIFISVFTYTVVQWRPVAASALGANSALRSSFAAGFPLFATQMAGRLGTVGTAALLAGLNCLIDQIPLPFIFARYGPQLRARSRFTL
ncbi:hypothetical protein CBS101457_003438 [Exobasidium rhododendri]|nr:hypothetical protein CBS101457_003438 [Exobasidium rhododendri]